MCDVLIIGPVSLFSQEQVYRYKDLSLSLTSSFTPRQAADHLGLSQSNQRKTDMRYDYRTITNIIGHNSVMCWQISNRNIQPGIRGSIKHVTFN